MLRRKLFKSPIHPNASSASSDDQSSGLIDSSLQNCCPKEVSKFFPGGHDKIPLNPLPEHLLEIQTNLNNSLNKIDFLKPPIRYVYNPTEYARVPHELYFRKYYTSRKPLIFVGMNPGPHGMCQTGVPFGDTNWVRNWLQIEGLVSKPPKECPKRPVRGFNCTRKEPSGDKFWSFWSEQCGTAANFFQNAFVYNYCPLAFMESSGRNVTPSDMKEDRKALETVCDKYYLDAINLMQPEIIVAIGRYVEKRSLSVLKHGKKIKVLCLPHPSPRSPNNQDWHSKTRLFLDAHNLNQFFTKTS